MCFNIAILISNYLMVFDGKLTANNERINKITQQ